MTELATFQTIDDRPVLRFERHLAHPPEKVWKAITDPAELSHWFPARFEAEPKAGAGVRFVYEDQDIPAGAGVILEYDPPKVFSYSWDESVLRWEILPEGTGSALVFTHTLSGAPPWGDGVTAARHAAGWDVCLAFLQAGLDDDTAAPAGAAWLELSEQYVERFGLGEAEVHDRADGYEIRFVRDVVMPAEEVWAALVPDPVSVPPRLVNDRFPAGRVTAVEPPRFLEYAWQRDGVDAGRVRWEVIHQDFACRLVLTQTVPAELKETAPQVWREHLRALIPALYEPADDL